jgi:hypothetical protein
MVISEIIGCTSRKVLNENPSESVTVK